MLEILSRSQLHDFIERGVLVVEDVLDASEINCALIGLKDKLQSYGVESEDLMNTGSHLSNLSSTHGSGGILDIFYPPWKLKVCENARLFGAMRDLWQNTYGANLDNFKHPFAQDMDPTRGFMYLDRVGFRVPDSVSIFHARGPNKPLQRSLTPHLDCCPHNMAPPADTGAISKWRPIQAFIALTDTMDKNTGGFECVPGFHTEFEEWAKNRPPETRPNGTFTPPPCVGNFTPIRPRGDADVLKRVTHVPVKAGSAVLWDVRIPHANEKCNNTNKARIVVYTGFLPYTPMNKRYAEHQLNSYRRRVIPQDLWIGSEKLENAPDHEWSELGRRLMAIDPWM